MAASVTGVFSNALQKEILQSKVLVVGAGGIGCEVLKNLVMSGFPEIEIIDLDTIDLSNLNRQFLFHREHVGKSKAVVARESALQFNPNVKIKAYHDSIMATDYGVNFFKRFSLVLSALDNRAARNHVNRMCLNADVPLIESGTAGYNGQVELIKKGLTQCYECTPKAKQKTFPGCTIRNTPSEPIHCIVWAKHLFNQLFGETDDNEDISPDFEDPEAKQKNVEEELNKADAKGDVKRISTRDWARECNYDAETLFNKLFYDDIKYLLTMGNLWKSRKPPAPIKWDSILLDDAAASGSKQEFLRQYHKTWSLAECVAVFADCIKKLKLQLSAETEFLVWDKDDQPAMDFVAACANIRAYIFEIGKKTRFEIKSMAGNIIPAIATTNAITAGVVVMQAFKVLQDELDKCKSVYMRLVPNARQQVLVPEKFLTPPNPACYVCSAEPAIHLKIDTQKMKVKDLRDEVLIKTMNMVNPDVIYATKQSVIISSDKEETECFENKTLAEMDIHDGALLSCDDFLQNYTLSVIIVHIDAERDELFEVIADKNLLKPKEEEPPKAKAANGNAIADKTDLSDGPSTSKKARVQVIEEEDDCCILDDEEEDTDATVAEAANKLKVSSPDKAAVATSSTATLKRQSAPMEEDEDFTEILDSDEEEGPTQSKRLRTVEA